MRRECTLTHRRRAQSLVARHRLCYSLIDQGASWSRTTLPSSTPAHLVRCGVATSRDQRRRARSGSHNPHATGGQGEGGRVSNCAPGEQERQIMKHYYSHKKRAVAVIHPSSFSFYTRRSFVVCRSSSSFFPLFPLFDRRSSSQSDYDGLELLLPLPHQVAQTSFDLLGDGCTLGHVVE